MLFKVKEMTLNYTIAFVEARETGKNSRLASVEGLLSFFNSSKLLKTNKQSNKFYILSRSLVPVFHAYRNTGYYVEVPSGLKRGNT